MMFCSLSSLVFWSPLFRAEKQHKYGVGRGHIFILAWQKAEEGTAKKNDLHLTSNTRRRFELKMLVNAKNFSSGNE